MTLVEYYKQRFLTLMMEQDIPSRVDRDYNEIESVRVIKEPSTSAKPGVETTKLKGKEQPLDRMRSERKRKAEQEARARENDRLDRGFGVN
jgi:hypothetical protein